MKKERVIRALRRMDETLENLLKLGAISAKEYAPAHLDAMRYSRNLKRWWTS